MVKLKDFIEETNFEKFCNYFRENVLLKDSSLSFPTDYELMELFNLFDINKNGYLNKNECKLLNEHVIHRINALRSALIVVDFQNDFVAGSLAIKNGPAKQDPQDALIPLNRLIERCSNFRRIIYTLDWHPSNHISFYEHCRNSDRTLSNEDKKRKLMPFDTVYFDNPGFQQVLYPTHCVQNSWGSELSPELIRAEGAKYVLKGSQVFVDAYSGFVDNQGQYRSELEPLLRGEKIEALFICGLAMDICVAATAKDAAKLNFFTAVISDCSKGLSTEQINSSINELCSLNVAVIDSNGVNEFLDSKKIPWRWLSQLMGLNCCQQKKNHQKIEKNEENSNIKGNFTENLNEMTSKINENLLNNEENGRGIIA